MKLNKVIATAKFIKKNPILINTFIYEMKKNGVNVAVKKAIIKANKSVSGHSTKSSHDTQKISPYEVSKFPKDRDEKYYKDFKVYEEQEFDIKAIAFYLPQFHPLPENDLNWGRGFTEWTNVTKASPNFHGHYQPQLPIDLGFYDLRIVDNIKRQAELARNYGVHGFCFHHYWFDGKGVMRTPIDLLLENKDININFCINWANENWTKTWDGREKDILLKQNHCDQDDLAFIKDSSRYFQDRRYIRVDGKPLLMVYRPSLFPDIKKTVSLWRNWYKENFNEELYLVLTDSFENLNPDTINFDASVNFVPNTLPLESIEYILSVLNPDFTGGIVSYDHAIDAIKNQQQPNYKKFRGICPAWDNTPRRQDTAYIVHGSTPEKYKEWLQYIVKDTLERFDSQESFIFINAWNEWAEGAHLEPDRKYGYAYLDATREVLTDINRNTLETVQEINSKFKKKSDVFFVIHAFYTDLWEEFVTYYNLLNMDADIYISIPYHVDKNFLEILKNFNCKIYLVDNINRDIGPFIQILPELQSYHYGCKVSLKKSETEIVGDIWRETLFEELFDPKIKNIFNDSKIGMAIPDSFALDFNINISSNFESISTVCKQLKIPYPAHNTLFSAGTMFWFRPVALKQLASYHLSNNYEPLPQDGTELHALERMFAYICQHNNFSATKINDLSSKGSQKTFFENILSKNQVISKHEARVRRTNKNNLMIFVHYNKDNQSIENNVIHYLNSFDILNCDIIFISNSQIDTQYLDKIKPLAKKIIIRGNIGYDFLAYKKGLSIADYWNYEKVILANDTLVGPLYNFSENYSKIINSTYDIFGMTASKQFWYHIQSFFICFDKKVTQTEDFKVFWSNVNIKNNVMDVIMEYELNLTRYFIDRRFSASALYNFPSDTNIIMHEPKKLLNDGFAFIKKKYMENLTDDKKTEFQTYLLDNFNIDINKQKDCFFK